MTIKPPTTAVEVVPPPAPFVWSYTYDGPITKVDDRSCELCNAASSGKCAKTATQHGSGGCTPTTCTTAWAAKVGYCHNHHGLADSLAAHPNDHEIDVAHKPSFEAVCRGILHAVAALPKDTKRVTVKAEARQNLELTMQTVRIDIASWR